MVICKYYVQGNCRFGENCKFEHQLGGSSHSNSILRQQTLNHGNQQQNTGAPVDNNTVIKMVQMDMTNTEKGGQWMFSCYTPFKDKPPFPGFEDKSFEEVRLAFYEAKNNGTLESFKQEIQNNAQKNIMQIKALQNPNQEAQSLILEIYHSPPGSGKIFTATPTLFSSNNLGNTFTNTSNNPFGQSQNSVFGNSTPHAFGNNQLSIFGGNTSTNTFGNNTNQSQNVFAKSGSTFGGANQQSMFGAPSSFGNQPSSMNSVFSQNSSTSNFQSQGSIFGNNSQNTTVFGQNSSIFSNPAVQQQASFFTQQGTPSTFSNNQPTSTSQAFTGSSFTTFRNPTESMNTGSIFTSQPATSSVASSIFANAVANFTASQKSNAPFGTNPNVSTSFVSSSGLGTTFTNQSSVSTSATTPTFGVSPFNSTSAFNSGNTAMVFTTSQSNPTDLSNKSQPSPNTSIFNTQNLQTSTAPVVSSQGASIFSSQTVSSSIFARPQTGGSIFSTQPTAQNTSIFGSASITPVATQTGLIFGQQPSGGAASSHTTSIFGGAAAQSSSNSSGPIASLSEVFSKLFYSKLEDLTEEEIREFKADTFEFGKIPDKPPPLELCK